MAASPQSRPYRELLLGAGNSRIKRIPTNLATKWAGVTTLDINPDTNPDVEWDLWKPWLPFDADTFDEIHAYEVLEHIGQQGDYRLFFAQFSDYWRILKPGGLFCATVPDWKSKWAWGDPGHTRVINEGTITFLSQKMYEQVGMTPMTDYRGIYKADFDILMASYTPDHFVFMLQAVK